MAEIEADPSLLVTGEALKERLGLLDAYDVDAPTAADSRSPGDSARPRPVVPDTSEASEEPESPPSEEVLAQRESGSMLARWSEETRHRIVMEFIRESNLSTALNVYLKKRVR